jgi:hypothetical protein
MGRTRMKRYSGLLEVGLDLPVLVGDEDFIEHLHESGFVDVIDVNDLIFEWLDWSKENVNE